MSASISDTQGMPNGKVPFQFDVEGEEQFELLKASLTLGEGFQLFFIGCSSIYGWDEIQKRLDQYSQENKVDLIVLHYKKPDELDRLFEDLITLPESNSESWMLVRTEGMDDERKAGWNASLSLLNERRNKLMKDCPRSIIFMDTPWLIQFAPGRAPDLWSVRTSAVIFSEVLVSSNEHSFRRPNLMPMWHEMEEGEYYYNLAQAFIDSTKREEMICCSNLLRKAGKSWEIHGKVHKAFDVLEQALKLNFEMKNDFGIAATQDQIADIYYRQDDYKKALSIREEQVLPVFEKLKDQHGVVVTQGGIADILYQEGDFDEALHIRKDIELPFYEKQNDLRSQAIVKGKIADIYFERAQYDEALRIRQEEELPIYVELGDIHSEAMVKGDIADILAINGHLDQALYLRTVEELPVLKRLGDIYEQAICMEGIAFILVRKGELEKALCTLDEVVAIYEKLEMKNPLSDVHKFQKMIRDM